MRQHWAKCWSHQLTFHPYWMVFILWLVCAPSMVILVDHYVDQRYFNQQQDSIEQAQKLLSERTLQADNDLNLTFSRFKELPKFLSTHELFIEALSQPTSAELLVATNKKLKNMAHFLSVDLIMLIDQQGMCIAASNFERSDSVVGTSLVDRQYVQQALTHQLGHQYAVGRKTGIPGFYFAAPVYEQSNTFAHVKGLVASKLNLDQALQRVHLGNAILVDEQNRIIYASDATWLHKHLLEVSSPAPMPLSEGQLMIQPADFGNPLVKQISHMSAPALVHALQRTGDSFNAYLIEPIPELLPLKTQYEFFYQWVMLTSLIMLWGLLASLVFIRRGQLDRRAIHEKNHELILLNQQLKQQAETDFLTGCLNRREFDKTLRELIAQSQASTQLCLALFDVDHFKRVNDSYGHDVGDKALQHISAFVRDHSLSSDILSRIGGEEFTLIMPNATIEVARERLEAMRADLAITPLVEPSLTEPVTLTVSIGLTQLLPSDNASKLLQRADHAMYHAKEKGRNQTFVL